MEDMCYDEVFGPVENGRVCVYYCSSYYKAVCVKLVCVFITAVPVCVYYQYYKAVRPSTAVTVLVCVTVCY